MRKKFFYFTVVLMAITVGSIFLDVKMKGTRDIENVKNAEAQQCIPLFGLKNCAYYGRGTPLTGNGCTHFTDDCSCPAGRYLAGVDFCMDGMYKMGCYCCE